MINFLIGMFIGGIGGFFLATILATASRGSRMEGGNQFIYRGRHKIKGECKMIKQIKEINKWIKEEELGLRNSTNTEEKAWIRGRVSGLEFAKKIIEKKK